MRLIQIASDQPILLDFARLGMHVVRQEKSSESFRSKTTLRWCLILTIPILRSLVGGRRVFDDCWDTKRQYLGREIRTSEKASKMALNNALILFTCPLYLCLWICVSIFQEGENFLEIAGTDGAIFDLEQKSNSIAGPKHSPDGVVIPLGFVLSRADTDSPTSLDHAFAR